MNNLDEIKAKYGTETPYSVPENYFEQFGKQIMAKLPEKEVKQTPVITLWRRIKPIIYLAAMFAAAIWTINLYVGKNPVHTTSASTLVSGDQDAESVTLAMSADDYSLYEYLNEGKTN
jgi:hypothetical protein